jgi:hypothetical protein
LGEEMLWGDVGRFSWSRSRPSDEAFERREAGDRMSVGETLPLFSRALVSLWALSVYVCTDGWGAPATWVGDWKGSGELTAEVSIVIVGARSRRRGADC